MSDLLLLAGGTIFSIAAGIPFPLLAILFGQLIDDINSTSCAPEYKASKLGNATKQKVLYVVYVTIASWCFIYIHVSCWTMFGERLVRRIRENYLRSLLRQELGFFDEFASGQASSELRSNLDSIQTGTSEKVGICLASLSYCVAAYVVAFMKVPQLAGFLVSLLPAYLMMSLGGSWFIKLYTNRVAKHLASMTSIVSETLNKVALIHAFGAASQLERKLAEHFTSIKEESNKKAIAAAVQLGLLYFIAYSTNALAYWQGSKTLARSVASAESSTNVGAVYTVIFLLIDASYLISQVAPFLQIFGTATAASERLNETLERSSRIDSTDLTDGKFLNAIEGSIEFTDLDFSYPSRPTITIFQGLNLKIPAGKNTAIVGRSGSGKSTLASLLMRLYDLTQGAIYLDGHTLKSLNVRHLRSCIALVSPDTPLLNRSILENIAHGLINAPGLVDDERLTLTDGSLSRLILRAQGGQPLEQVLSSETTAVQSVVRRCIQAAEVAGALDFIIKLKHGFASSTGQAGELFSGGQKQRLALARAVVRDAPILLLDEATSALDSAGERSIRKAIQQVAKGRTTISIVHRLSTIKTADNIVVLDKGQVVEQGTHHDLIVAGGTYSAMVQLQNMTFGDGPDADRTRFGLQSVDNIDVARKPSEKVDDAPANAKTTTTSISRSLTMSRASFNTVQSSGHKDDHPKLRGLWATMTGVLTMTRPRAIQLFIALTAAVVVGGSFSGEAVIFGNTVSSLSTCHSSQDIARSGRFWALLFFILAIVEFSANFLMSSCFGRVSESVLERIRIASYNTLLAQNVEWHHSDGRTPATLLSYITTDTNAIAGLTGTIVGTAMSIIISMTAGVVLSHIVEWRIAIVLLGCIPILLGAGIMKFRSLATFHRKHAEAYANATGLAVEAVDTIRTIAAYSLEEDAVTTYHEALQAPYSETLRSVLRSDVWFATAYSASSLVYALAYWWGSKNVADGYYSQTRFFIVLPAMLFSAQKCGQLFSMAPDFSKSRISAARILDLLDLRTPNKPPSRQSLESTGDGLEKDTSDLQDASFPCGAEVRIQDVHFSYPVRPDDSILRGLDLHILPGQFCALVGPSGAGKSTIIAMIERFYASTSGVVSIDGRDISKLSGTDFRNPISLVQQDNILFEGSIHFNLSLGARPGQIVTDEQLEEACRLADIHETIQSLPEGYDTCIGPNGGHLSEGQKQRLSIARALLRKPRLLLLDESTSALDAQSEGSIQNTLDQLRGEITIIAIARRLHTVEQADKIFVIEEGRCTAKGTHQQLMRESETYRTNALH
ncbi:ABC multidrug transporter SidT [Aureobasidium pullulans]|uniref:ABC multidrug transporter SidT n=1 Tax=Aureobasidium pullulans TaxID=5580 RepID=A0A4S8XBG9_AURPU|nr:ABC multidrug transporter SidT [Aureobasidium pullulans]